MVNSIDTMHFPSIKGKPVLAQFNGGQLSSDAGILLLKKIDDKLGLSSSLSQCIVDSRQQSKVRQPIIDMLRQRIYGIACGYEDCNDFDTLCSDPLLKMAVERPPKTGADLASQPTLSRLENSVSKRELLAMAAILVSNFITRHQDEAPTQIILDIDATDDPAHGQQELEFFHGYYGCHCFLPLLIFATVDTGEQEVITTVLRPGNKHAGYGSVGILRRIVRLLRASFPMCKFVVRGDAGYALPALYDWCEREGIDYVISLAQNNRLLEIASSFEEEARQKYEETLEKVRHFGEFYYKAGSWPKPRRVVVKAEMMAKGYNPRFVVTNLPADNPLINGSEELYDFYTDRGDVENRIKELKNDLLSGRTSCHLFLANQFRLLLHAAAFVLLQALQTIINQIGGPRWQAGTVRMKLIKVAALVIESVRRIVIKLPNSYPLKPLWKRLAVEWQGGQT